MNGGRCEADEIDHPSFLLSRIKDVLHPGIALTSPKVLDTFMDLLYHIWDEEHVSLGLFNKVDQQNEACQCEYTSSKRALAA